MRTEPELVLQGGLCRRLHGQLLTSRNRQVQPNTSKKTTPHPTCIENTHLRPKGHPNPQTRIPRPSSILQRYTLNTVHSRHVPILLQDRSLNQTRSQQNIIPTIIPNRRHQRQFRYAPQLLVPCKHGLRWQCPFRLRYDLSGLICYG